MTTKHRRTAAEYEAAAADYEANPITADRIRSIELGPGYLPVGRPVKGKVKTGNTPALPVRLPDQIRTELNERVKAGESGSASELVRLAVVEYFENHPRTA